MGINAVTVACSEHMLQKDQKGTNRIWKEILDGRTFLGEEKR